MKKIIGIASGILLLGIFMFFQLQAMKQKMDQIYVYITEDAIQSLGLGEKAKSPFLIRLSNNTTAQDVIEEIAMPTTELYMPSYAEPDAFHPYAESLIDAYNQGLLSLWAVFKEGESLKPLTPKRKFSSDDLITDFLNDYGDIFVIRYNK